VNEANEPQRGKRELRSENRHREELGRMKAAIVVLADTETHGDLGRVVNALVAAKEFKEAGDDVKVIFDGAGTQWPGLLADERHKSHSLWESVANTVAGACGYCAGAFDANEGLQEAKVHLIDDYHGHPSIRSLAAGGHQIITF
jgi:tRNA U54 and U55 pseudouridine synthase Pus10